MDSAITMNPFDEKAFVSPGGDGDTEGFTEIYDQYFSRVYGYAMYRLQDAQAADDATALIFERVMTRLHTYQPSRGPFTAWLFSVARNVINNYLRSQKSRNWSPLDTAAENRPITSTPLEEVASRNMQLAHMMSLIGDMDERSRDLIALKFGAGLTNRRIAEMTGLSESNVGVILYRTIAYLRDQLGVSEYGGTI